MNKKEVLDALVEEFAKSLKGIDATNGDVIKALFPSTKVEECHKDYEGNPHLYRVHGLDGVTDFTGDWWNAKYKGVLE